MTCPKCNTESLQTKAIIPSSNSPMTATCLLCCKNCKTEWFTQMQENVKLQK
jgi:transcription elongation factor Elf1